MLSCNCDYLVCLAFFILPKSAGIINRGSTTKLIMRRQYATISPVMDMERKPNRIEDYDYSQNGAYFITICTQDRKRILSKITVGTGVLDCPQVQLLKHGEIADKYICQLHDFYANISVDRYVIMPDHIHILMSIQEGQSRTPVPTGEIKIDSKNSTVSKFVSTFKRFCNKEYGENIWQRSFYDHIIRNQHDYDETWEYIEHNPKKWAMTR